MFIFFSLLPSLFHFVVAVLHNMNRQPAIPRLGIFSTTAAYICGASKNLMSLYKVGGGE